MAPAVPTDHPLATGSQRRASQVFMEAHDTERASLFMRGSSRFSLLCAVVGCSGENLWPRAGTPREPHTHSERHRGMLRYNLDHSSANCFSGSSIPRVRTCPRPSATAPRTSSGPWSKTEVRQRLSRSQKGRLLCQFCTQSLVHHPRHPPLLLKPLRSSPHRPSSTPKVVSVQHSSGCNP